MTEAEVRDRLKQVVEELSELELENPDYAMKLRKIEALLKERAELWAELERLRKSE